mmetsp:Transcript_26475/g.56329  ORF Transcript_26475/g.56329 Transcript_26475/m.56329 type:complete len:169 (-) Transcript_26475:26-532(-)
MVKLSTLSFLVGSAAMQRCRGFVAAPQSSSFPTRIPHPDRSVHAADGDNDAGAGGVEAVSLAALGDDHEAVGEMMAKSVAAWLDEEWMPQEIHLKMGTSVKNTYVTCRSKGMDEVAEIMTEVTDELYASWSEYNADAFVNAWDVGNYVADYLIAKSGSETCGCSTKIV